MIPFHEIANNSGYSISIQHIPTGRFVSFPCFLTQFSDDYSLNWSGESVYGRMDNIQTYKNTSRKLAIDFDVLAESEKRGEQNMIAVRELIRFLYPKYNKVDQQGFVRTLSAPPLLKIKFANLIESSTTGEGILGALSQFSYKPTHDSGYIMPKAGVIYARAFSVSLSIDVLHDHDVGWNEENNWLGGADFPYGLDSRQLQAESSRTAGSSIGSDPSNPVNQSRVNTILK